MSVCSLSAEVSIGVGVTKPFHASHDHHDHHDHGSTSHWLEVMLVGEQS